jgi:hypothetical protein
MLSVVGLCLDVVGALALILGLFTHARIPTYAVLGQRTPEEVAHDVGFAIVGGTLLTLGFVFQSLTYLDVSVETTRACTLAAGLATLVGACLFGYVVYGVGYGIVYERERLYVHRTRPEAGDLLPPFKPRKRQGFKYWLREQPPKPPPTT